MSNESPVTEAHRKAQWLAYQKHLAEVEELRALEQAYERAAQELLAMRAQLLDAQIDRQRAELAWQAMGLARGAELLDIYREGLQAIIREVGDPLSIVRQLKEKLKERPCDAIDWTPFDAEFRSTYPEFQSKLIALYPELTGMEMRVCELLKLQVALTDIATLLCLSRRRLEGERLRILRKMGLAPGEDVHAVLAGI